MQSTVQDFLRLQVRGDAHAAETFAALKASLLQYPASPQTLQNGLALLRDADEGAAISNLHVPTLVVAGEYDRITHPEASAQLAQQLPDARLVSIKRAGHAPFISHRDEFMIATQNFLSHVVDEAATRG
jgi:pimeloyl-[acyl-carrier protein] methyl ester esterase